MTTIDVDTSPLQAAREWRGIGLVAVAMNCGLPVTQAEALEAGDPEAFDSIDEMIAAAVVYGASIGIGRDEAMALLDRTVGRAGATAVVPDATPARPGEGFSGAVAERSARIAERGDSVVTPPIVVPALPDAGEVEVDPGFVPVDEPAAPAAPAALDAELPEVPAGPSPQQAVDASGELMLDEAFGPDAPWDRAGNTGELEAWVDDYDELSERGAHRGGTGEGLAARVGGGLHAGLERIVGSDRADAVADRTRELSARATELARRGREQLRRSEHATLIVAIGAGAILIALVVALGGALGGDDAAGPGPADRTEAAAPAKADATAAGAAATAEPVAQKPMIPPARLTVDVYNAGSQKGKAKTVAGKVKAAGYKVGAVTNTKSDYSTGTIIHPADMAREARLLARRVGITKLQVAPGSTRRITVIVR